MSDEDLRDVRPKLTLVLGHDGPIPLADFTLALTRLANRYVREARAAGDDDAPQLYIAQIRQGSTVVDLVTHHVPAIITATTAGIAAVAAGNTLFKFGENLKAMLEHFKKGSAAEVTKADCDDARALAAPIMNTLNGSLTINISLGPEARELLAIDQQSAREIDNRAALERAALTQKEENIHTGVLFVWDQVRDAPGVTDGRSPDRGVISEIDNKPRQTTFASDDIKEKMGRHGHHPFEKAFVVDVKVLVSPTGPAGYRILAVHDVLDRE